MHRLFFLPSCTINVVKESLCTNSGTNLYPESTRLVTEMEATGVQLKPETYIESKLIIYRQPVSVATVAT